MSPDIRPSSVPGVRKTGPCSNAGHRSWRATPSATGVNAGTVPSPYRRHAWAAPHRD